MNKKNYYITVGIVFTVVGVLHLLRAILGWDIMVISWGLPIWVSYAVSALALYLAYRSWKLSKL